MNTPTPPHYHTSTHPLWLIHLQKLTHDGYLIIYTCKYYATCSESLTHTNTKSTHLVNAFLLVHHPSAHRTKTAALPFSTLQ